MVTPKNKHLEKKEPIAAAIKDKLPDDDLEYKVKICVVRGFYVSIVSLVITAIGVVAGVMALFAVNHNVQTVGKNLLASQFTLTKIDGSEIQDSLKIREDGVLVSGRTPYSGELNHYVIVTWPGGLVDYVQPKAIVSFSGNWDASAKIGDVDTPPGTKFVIRCLATSSVLAPGPLLETPANPIYSDAVVVIR